MNHLQQENKTTGEAQLALAESAAAGEKTARIQVNEILHPLIDFQTSRFCKRFCSENQYLYRCTLKPPMGSMRADVAWCEWGNGSYGWMLNDLGQASRLRKYQGINGARLFDYFYQIANSLPFYERWKDWRFGRRVHVPTYIQAISPQAGRIFLALRAGENLQQIGQRFSKSSIDIEPVVQRIISMLTEKKRLYLLDPPKLVSMSETADELEPDQIGNQSDRQIELGSYDEAIELREDKLHLHQAWSKLEVVEQFVLEALLIDELDAEDVLSALRKLDLSIKKGVAAAQTNVQQLYYFRRKTLARLKMLMEIPMNKNRPDENNE